MSELKGRMIFVPLEEAQTPAEGHCFVNRWWTVHPEKGVAFYYKPFGYTRSEEPSPQCNSDEAVSRHVTKRLNPDCEVLFLPAVFLRHAERLMRKDRAALKQEQS